jgi:hypothetical protein
MRIPKWLAVVFFASLALNVGVLAGYFYQSYLWSQGRNHARTYFQDWAPDAERRFAALMDERLESRYRIDSLRMLTQIRLDELTYVDNPDSAEVEQLLNQAGDLERELARTAYRIGRRIRELKPPEKREQTLRAYRKLMGLAPADTSAAGVPGTKGR